MTKFRIREGGVVQSLEKFGFGVSLQRGFGSTESVTLASNIQAPRDIS
jgi:hypothetical protein